MHYRTLSAKPKIFSVSPDQLPESCRMGLLFYYEPTRGAIVILEGNPLLDSLYNCIQKYLLLSDKQRIKFTEECDDDFILRFVLYLNHIIYINRKQEPHCRERVAFYIGC